MSSPSLTMYYSNESKPSHDRLLDRLARGFLAGALGGLVGAGMKLVGEVIFPPRMSGEPVPPAVMVSRVVEFLSGSPLLPSRELLATQAVHWTFSIVVGGLFGMLAERFPRVKLGHGVVFGLVLCLSTHETLLPALGFSLPWSQMPLKEHLSELSTHALFGFSVEMVRRTMRRHVWSAHVVAAA